MSIKCSYTYKGKTYSEDRLLRLLLSENPSSFVKNQEESIKWLTEKTGLSENEIEIVSGLIENKSLGRFLSDGRILLSEFADVGVAYHEGFHRVFRTALTPTERSLIREEFKKRKNYKDKLLSYKSRYPKLSENDLIEEHLADEFSDYVRSPETYVIETPIKSFFDKLINFLKKLLGLSPLDINTLYKNILDNKYKNKQVSKRNQYRASADMIKISNEVITTEEKIQIVHNLSKVMISNIVKSGPSALKDFVQQKKRINIYQLYKVAMQNTIDDLLATGIERYENIALALDEDFELIAQNKRLSASSMYTYVNSYIEKLGITTSNDELTDKDLEEFVSEMNDTEYVNSRGEFVSNLEIDPKSNMSKQIKILLGSFYDPNEKTPMGFDKPVHWSKAFLEISESMAGVPTEEFMDVLVSKPFVYKDQLINFLEGDSKDRILFRNEFVSTLAKTINNINVMQLKNGDIYFFNANVNTRASRIEKDWQNNLQKIIKDYNSFEDWRNALKALLIKTATPDQAEILLGINVDPELYNEIIFSNSKQDYWYMDIVRNIAQTIINNQNYSNANLPDFTNLFKQFDVNTSVQRLSQRQSAYEDAVDMMVYAGGKKLYGLGLNTHATIIINRLNYAQTRFTPDMTVEDKINILKEYVPYVVSEFNTTKNQDGSVVVNNKWLQKILNGEKLSVNIIYNVNNDSGQSEETSDLNETDLHAMHLNGTLQGMNMSVKHSDRSIFYAYSFDKSNEPLINPQLLGITTEDGMLEYLSEYLLDQIKQELKIYNLFKDQFQAMQIFGNKYKDPGIAELIGNEWENIKKTNSVSPDLKKTIKNVIITKYYQPYILEIEKWEIDKLGISKTLLANYNHDLPFLLSTAFVNEIVNHIEEIRLFNGDIRFYKTAVDFFKRQAPVSSTGMMLVNDKSTNDLIRQEIAKNKYNLVNPLTGEKIDDYQYPLSPDGTFRSITIKEESAYKSFLLESAVSQNESPIISKLTGKNESKLFMIYENQLLKDLENTTITSDIKTDLINKIKRYEKSYDGVNENDGQSWMNIIAFKNYMIRLGQWTPGMENVFKIEMQILNAKSFDEIKNIEIEYKGKKIKVFEIPKNQTFKYRTYDNTAFQIDPFHTLKTQFSGFSYAEEYHEMKNELMFYATSIFKTSQHVLMPSAIIGTNLQLMNYTMLKNGIDIIHMGSANKIGGIDPKIAAANKLNDFPTRKHLSEIAKNGLSFYDSNGNFNHDAIDENLDVISYLSDINFLKDQVKIGNKIKTEIKGSTQSLKILLSNLLINGRERFNGANEIVEEYKNIISEIVKRNYESLMKELNYDGLNFQSKDALQKVLLESSQAKGAPENLLNAIENFVNDPLFEILPNKNKIENILYSLITNKAIAFNRPGNSYPQASITGYESLGSRKKLNTNQDTLKFYDVVFNDAGDIVKVNPAEIMLPLPDDWIDPVLEKYNTRNIVEAINKLNADIANGKINTEVTFKGLRIPNQQLSSNDIFKIKKFTIPTGASYVIVPSEIVVKVGSDS